MLILLLLVLLWLHPKVNGGDKSAVLKTMSINYGRQVHPCLEELHLGHDVLTDFLNYWQPDHNLTNIYLGCAVLCVETKLQLLDDAGKLSQVHAEEWVKAAGADEGMAKYVTYLYQSCKEGRTSKDPCKNALEVINCFRTAIQQAHWVPEVPVDAKKKRNG